MKQAENNEIDTLLRNLARRERAAQSEPDSAPRDFAAKGAHLDIDELSSYAERALPPTARARCTAHLADCDDCRKIVAQLSVAAGPLAGEPRITEGVVAGSTWIQKLSTLFAPRMIRYAAPVLVLVVVVFAFFGWRQQRTNPAADYVARNEGSKPALATKSAGEQTAATDRPDETNSKSREVTSSGEQKEAKPQPTSVGPAPAATISAEDKISDEKKSGGEASGTTTVSKAGKQDAPTPAADKAAAEQPAYATEPPPAAAKTQSSVAANQEQQKDLAKNNLADDTQRGRDANVQQRKGPARNDEVASQRGPAKREAQPAPKLKAAETGAAAGARTEEDKSETRTVSGRHFRRVSNAWVDTAYKSSMSIRGVTRGTEGYRALVADEPVIGSIGKQLSGEVIVVWKGHAYRIN